MVIVAKTSALLVWASRIFPLNSVKFLVSFETVF